MLRLAAVAAAASLHGASAAVFSIADYGAVGDGVTLNTKAIQVTIAAAGNGNTVLFPSPGRWLTGSVNFTSGQTLLIPSGSVVLGSTDVADFPLIPALPSYGVDRDIGTPFRYEAIIGCFFCSGFNVRGSGVVDGQGAVWWQRFRNHTLAAGRPHLFEVYESSNVTIQGDGSGSMLTFTNSPFWTTHLYATNTVHVQYLNISNPIGTSNNRVAPNTDGIDPDSSTNVLIEDCVIAAGDDGVAIKSGIDNPGIAFNRPSQGITVRNTEITSPCCAGVCIGSETSGGIANVFVTNVTVHAAANAFYIKSAKGRGAYVTNVTYTNGTVNTGVMNAISVSAYYGGSCTEPFCNATLLPDIRGITFSNIASGPGQTVLAAGSFAGLDGSLISELTVRDVSVSSLADWSCSYVDPASLTVDNVSPGGLSRACGK